MNESCNWVDLLLHRCWTSRASHYLHYRCVAGKGHHVVAPPCPWSTARLQRSPVGRVESFHSWLSHLFCGRPCGRCHVWSGGQLRASGLQEKRALIIRTNFLGDFISSTCNSNRVTYIVPPTGRLMAHHKTISSLSRCPWAD